MLFVSLDYFNIACWKLSHYPFNHFSMQNRFFYEQISGFDLWFQSNIHLQCRINANIGKRWPDFVALNGKRWVTPFQEIIFQQGKSTWWFWQAPNNLCIIDAFTLGNLKQKPGDLLLFIYTKVRVDCINKSLDLFRIDNHCNFYFKNYAQRTCT